MNKEITSQDVAEWLKAQLPKAQLPGRYANITIDIRGFEGDRVHGPFFSIYRGPCDQSQEKKSIEDCFAELAGKTTSQIVTELREKAAALIAEAERLTNKGQ